MLQNCKEYYVNGFKRRLDKQQWLVFEDDDFRQQHQLLVQEILAKLSVENREFKQQIEQNAKTWICETEKLNDLNKYQLNVLEKRVDAKVRAIEEQKYDHICRKEETISLSVSSDCGEEIYHQLSADITLNWLELLERIVASEVQLLSNSLRHVSNVIQMYKKNFVEHFRKKLCVDHVEFEELHKASLEIAKQNVSEDLHTRRNNWNLFYKLIENQKKILCDTNNRIFLEEKRIATEAYNYALDSYQLLMDKQIISTTLSKQELQRIHKRLSSEIVDIFLKGLQVPHTEPWKRAQHNLELILMSLETKYVEKNRNHLANVELVRSKAKESGKQNYRNEMSKVLQTTKLSEGKFHELSDSCYHKAIRTFHENIDGKVNKNISQLWKDDFRIAIDEIKLTFLKKNECKPQDQPIHSTKNQPKTLSRSNGEKQPYNLQPSKEMHRYGIALYIDAQTVTVGVFVDQQIQYGTNLVEYDHTITVNSIGEVLIGEEALTYTTKTRQTGEKPNSSNVFTLLCSNVPVYWTVKTDKKSVIFKPDELLSLFFQKIRMNTELLVDQSVTSCYVAVSGLLSCGAKQMLKTCLMFAGFENNILIPYTTAMAISYCLKFREGDLAFQRTQSNLFVYICNNLVEFAAVNVSREGVNVKNVYGHIDILSATGSMDKVKNALRIDVGNIHKIFEDIFRDTNSQQIKRIIFCDATHTGQQKILSNILEVTKKNLSYCIPTHFTVTDDIIRISSMLDASRNGSNVLSMPSYNYIHPYKISMKVDRERFDLCDFNDAKVRKISFRFEHDTKMEIYEEAKSSRNRWSIDTYKLNFSLKYISDIDVFRGIEGNLIVNVIPEGNSVESTYRSLTFVGRQEISFVLKPFIEQRKQTFNIQFSSINPSCSRKSQPNITVLAPPTNPLCNHKNQPQTEPNTITAQQKSTTDSSLEELKSSLIKVIETIQRELQVSQSTATAIRDNIESKIKKCLTLMNQSDVTVKNLEFEKNNLEQVSKYIKK